MNVLGLDIGGANVKAAAITGETLSRPFPLWRQPDDLTAALIAVAAKRNSNPRLVAATMTGELADCFDSKRDGVDFIVRAVEAAFPQALVRIWMTSGEFAEPDDAVDLPELVAAANWHALATWAARAVPRGRALLVDVGSTTSDLIPLVDGACAADGRTDLERLMAGELLYTGAARTPVCAVRSSVSLRGRSEVPLAAELFATMRDVRILTGDLPEQPQDTNTADGRPATRPHAESRLARMLCCDRRELTDAELLSIAEQTADAQRDLLASAIRQALDRLTHTANPGGTAPQVSGGEASGNERPLQTTDAPAVILSGSGTFLIEQALRRLPPGWIGERLRLSSMYRCNVSDAACAFAVARLAAERCLDDLLPFALPL